MIDYISASTHKNKRPYEASTSHHRNDLLYHLRLIRLQKRWLPNLWELAQMQQDELLEDDIALFGAKPTSIFTDDKGHQGQIVIEAGTLVWLASIYGDDLASNTYETGFETDLHGVAIEIMNNHPEAYKR